MAAKKWVTEVCAAWQKTLTSIFKVGDLLLRAKDREPHGAFEKAIENELPFKMRTAEALMQIARDRRLRNPQHVALLPRSWGTLVAISRMTDEEFTVHVASGLINPDATRAEIEARHDLPDDYSPKRREYQSTLTARQYVSSGRSDPDDGATTRQLTFEKSEYSTPLSVPTMPPQHYGALALIRVLVESDAKTRALAVKLLRGERRADFALVSQSLSDLMTGLKRRRRAKKPRRRPG